ncbi:unnamed protein product [Dovyalis caffra]|uniref:Uncharacterized protein n=1 Tax=Dovyalis caffra TaxID=77055 RepID=A0AAV1SJZ8_9ROSI|nr:unnamed protein product [Dovyalis caffra]
MGKVLASQMGKSNFRLAVKERVDKWARNLDPHIVFSFFEWRKKIAQERQAFLWACLKSTVMNATRFGQRLIQDD